MPLKATDLDNDNEDRINENFKNAFLNSMEREIEKRRILSKWLNSCHPMESRLSSLRP